MVDPLPLGDFDTEDEIRRSRGDDAASLATTLDQSLHSQSWWSLITSSSLPSYATRIV